MRAFLSCKIGATVLIHDFTQWSSARKARHFWPVALLGFSTTTAASLITPASPELQESFSVSRTVAFLPLTLYVIGLGLGPTIAAPLSEQFGRSIVYKVSVPVSILFLLGCGLSKSFASLCVCRLLAGTAGAPVLAIGSGTNADLFAPHDRALWSALSTMMPLLGPARKYIVHLTCCHGRSHLTLRDTDPSSWTYNWRICRSVRILAMDSVVHDHYLRLDVYHLLADA